MLGDIGHEEGNEEEHDNELHHKTNSKQVKRLMEETDLDLSLHVEEEEQHDHEDEPTTKTNSLKSLLEEADMEVTMGEVEGPPRASLIQVESTVEAES